MLQQIHLRNFIIIESLELDLSNGMTALTGETGAGKSILIDALELALGGRLNTKVVRDGSDRCDICVSFSLNNNRQVKQWLDERELSADDECIIRRTITKEGRTKSYINGQPAPLQLLREIGTMMVNIHGQHEHQNMLKRDQQRLLLDEYAGNRTLCEAIKKIYLQWQSVNEQIKTLQTLTQDKNQRREFLQYQLNEFAKLGLQQGDLEQLTKEHKQLAHADELIENYKKAIECLHDNEAYNITDLLHEVLHCLNSAQHVNPDLINNIELLQSASIQIEETTADIRNYLESSELNPERLHWLENRLSTIDDMARKHRIPAEELLTLQENLKIELEQLEHSGEQLEKLQENLKQLNNEYQGIAKKLSQKRQHAAKTLSRLVTDNMQQLGMVGGKFNIELNKNQQQTITPYGFEQVEFMVSANPGQKLQPLNKVASGGELSRISLAIQVITAQHVTTPTLIFDEVDVGIGGGVAEIVGRLLRKIGETTQVLCVTHLPQVAALAHQHFLVTKSNQQEKTQIQIHHLSETEKVKEIARMLGGIKITKQTLAHAKEMLAVM